MATISCMVWLVVEVGVSCVARPAPPALTEAPAVDRDNQPAGQRSKAVANGALALVEARPDPAADATRYTKNFSRRWDRSVLGWIPLGN